MERFFSYWTRYVAVIPDAERHYVQQYGKVVPLLRNELLHEPGRDLPAHWHFVLEGMVAAYSYNRRRQRVTHWLAMANDYFSTTRHPYSPHGQAHYIACARSGASLRIANDRLRHAQEALPAFSQLLHVLKQQKQKKQTLLLAVFKEEDLKTRYLRFMDSMPEMAKQLKAEEKMALLNLSPASYKRVHKYYLKRGH